MKRTLHLSPIMTKITRHHARSLASILLILSLLLCNGLTPASRVYAATTPYKLCAYAYEVMDANSGNVIYTQTENKRIYPASTIKLMTALVVLENNKLDRKVLVRRSVLKHVSSDAEKIGLIAGNRYTVRQLLGYLLISSAGDAAKVLAVDTCGSTTMFIQVMNAKASELGMRHTSFDNELGLDKGNGYDMTYSTASDMTVLARCAMQNPTIRSIVKRKCCHCNGYRHNSTNLFYTYVKYDKKLYTIIGSKTGSTQAAGHVLIATARDKAGHEVICSFFGKIGAVKTCVDIRHLLNRTFKLQRKGKLTLSL